MIAAVRRSYCCSRSSSSSISGSDARARFLPTVGSVFVVVPIAPVLLVKCLIDSRLHASDRRRSRHERRLRLFLNDLQQRIQLIDPVFRRTRGLLQTLIHGRHRLAHLLYVYADSGRDIIDVVGNRTRVPHQWIDVPVNLVQHVADFLVALSEIPRRRHERHRKDDHGDGHDAARHARDFAPQTRLGHDLFRVDRILKSAVSLQQQFSAADPSRHVREVCKGEAIYREGFRRGTKSAQCDIFAQHSSPLTVHNMPAVQFVVEGGRSLSGSIRPSGNKNAALPIVAAALISENKVHLENVPRIRDIETLVELIRSVGASMEWVGQNALDVHAKDLSPADLNPTLCAKIRASILLAAPLLARCGQVTLPPPGGDVIGRRRLDTHFLALEQLGATFTHGKQIEMRVNGFKGADVFLDEPSVTATENALVAASAATGTTILRNAASEPHVQDLAGFLIAMGAEIEGVGTNTMTIHGSKSIGSKRDVTHTIGPDHIEVGSFIGLAAVTRSELRIENAGIEHLRSTRMGFSRLGIECEEDGADLV